MQHKLAELLLRRKELAGKVTILTTALKPASMFVQKVTRQKINEEVDEATIIASRLTASQVTAEIDWYSKRLRLIDAAIQQANWTTGIDVPGGTDVMADYEAPDQPARVALP